MRRRPALTALAAVATSAALLLGGGAWWYSGRLGEALAEGRQLSAQVRTRGRENRQLQHVANVSRAEQALVGNQLVQARELLAKDIPGPKEPDPRGFAWHHLWQWLNDEQRTLTGHTGEIYQAAFSPDGSTLATASQDGSVRLWDWSAGQLLGTLRAHQGEVNCVAFSRDGTILASGGDDGTVRIWETARGKLLHTLAGHAGGANCVTFMPNTNCVASGGRDNAVRLWDFHTGEPLMALEGHAKAVSCLAISRSGQVLASGGDDHQICLWDLASGERTLTFGGHSNGVSAVAFSFDGHQILSCGRDRQARLWTALTGEPIKTFGPYHTGLHCGAFCERDRRLILATADGEIEIIDVLTSRVVRQIRGHAARVWNVAVSTDGRSLATASADRTIKIWNLIAGSHDESIDSVPAHVHAFAVSRDGRMAIAGGDSGFLAAWDVRTRQLRWRERIVLDAQPVSGAPPEGNSPSHPAQRSPTEGTVEKIAFHPDNHTFAVNCAGDSRLAVYDSRTGRQLAIVVIPFQTIDCLAYAPNGRQLAVGSRDGRVLLLDSEGYVEIKQATVHRPGLLRLTYTHDGRSLAVSGSDPSQITILDAETLAETRRLESDRPEDIFTVAFSADGRLLAAGGTNRAVHVWRTDNGEQVAALAGHKGSLTGLSFSADGRTLATSDEEGRIILWDPTTWELYYALPSNFKGPCFAAFDERGQHLVAAGPTASVDKWCCWSSVSRDSAPPESTPSETAAAAPPVRLGAEIKVNDVQPGYERDVMWASDTLAADREGNLVVGWYSKRDVESCRARVFSAAGAPLCEEFVVDAQASTHVPAVAINNRRTFVAAWPAKAEPAGQYHIYARRFDLGGMPLGPRVQVSEQWVDALDIEHSAGHPSVVLDDQGNYAVAWESAGPQRRSVYLRRFNASDQPQGEALVCNPTAASRYWARLASTSDDGLVVVWSGQLPQPGHEAVFARRFDGAGRPLDEQEWRVDLPKRDSTKRFVDVDVSPLSGEIVISWADATGNRGGPPFEELCFRRFSPLGEPLGGVVKVSDGEPVWSASLDIATSGEIATAWESARPDKDRTLCWIRARRFAADGAPLGPEFLVTQQFRGPQLGGCVAHLPNRQFAVAYIVNYMSPRGVFLQRFSSEPPADRAAVSRGP